MSKLEEDRSFLATFSVSNSVQPNELYYYGEASFGTKVVYSNKVLLVDDPMAMVITSVNCANCLYKNYDPIASGAKLIES